MAATALLVLRRPDVYLRYRQGLYVFQCVYGMLEAKLLLEYLHLSVGSTTGGLLFWLPDIVVNSAMPWQILHTLVYPMPLRTAVVVHGVRGGAARGVCGVCGVAGLSPLARGLATGCPAALGAAAAADPPSLPPPPRFCVQLAVAVLLSSNPYRCSVTLASCPVSGSRVAELANQASSALSIFSGASGATLFDPGNPRHQHRACLLTYAITQVVVGYVGALRMAWCQDRWARLHYLRRLESAEAVEMEWMLERLQPSLAVTVLELILTAAVLWGCIQLFYLNF